MVLLFGWKVTSSNALGSLLTWFRNSLRLGGFSSDGWLSSRCAKNASTITIRIGKAALRKNLLMARSVDTHTWRRRRDAPDSWM